MFKSIFSDADDTQPQPQHLPLPHLQLNIKAREKTLKNLQDKIHYEQTLLEDKNASYISLLRQEYKSKLTAVRLKQMQEELKVKSSSFKSIFAFEPPQENKENKAKVMNKVNEKLKEEYFKSYIVKPKEQENIKTMLRSYTMNAPEAREETMKGTIVRISNPQISKPTDDEEKLKEYELLRMNQLKKQYDLYSNLLSDLFEENEKLIEKTSDKFMCKNPRILEALEPVVLGSMNICAEDVAEAIIDEMLEEGVHFMNRLEQYKEATKGLMTQTVQNHEELVPEAKKRPLPYNLMKALKALDEYAEEDDEYGF